MGCYLPIGNPLVAGSRPPAPRQRSRRFEALTSPQAFRCSLAFISVTTGFHHWRPLIKDPQAMRDPHLA
jgi:hypothetical protein